MRDAPRSHLQPLRAALVCGLLTLGCDATADHRTTRTITIEPGPTLRGVGDTVDLQMSAPAMSRRGVIAALRLFPPSDLVAIHDSTGRYLRSVGRPGRGPGEFSRVNAFGFGPGDTLWIVDAAFSIHAFAPPPALTFVRTIRLREPFPGNVTALGFLTPATMVNHQVRRPRLLDWDGVERASFGPERMSERMSERMAVSGDNALGPVVLIDSTRLWRARAYEYVIELLNGDASVERRIARELDWFPADSAQRAAPWVARPIPRIGDIAIGDDGLLWVLILRAHREWKPLASPSAVPDGPIRPGRMPAVNMAQVFEGVLEVLDPRSGAVVATRELDGTFRGFAGSALLYSVEESESGTIAIRLWRMGLSPTPR